MAATPFKNVIRKARPDRPDLRDKPYQAKLINLSPVSPEPALMRKWVPLYRKLILNQGEEGACTGFGLAAVINYLIFRETWLNRRKHPFSKVSAAMLYRLARQYDEWPGEDYEGSSCRGALKGWHKHGVCSWTNWPHDEKKPNSGPKSKVWETEASAVPLGAYYRVERSQINDLQSAIHEVGAVFVSADVHSGWDNVETRKSKKVGDLPVIPYGRNFKVDGAHSFALVGYNPDGFVVQNSWGPDWGHHGFAVMTFEDWLHHGTDAWVAVMGAPRALRPKEIVSPFVSAGRPPLAAKRTGAGASPTLPPAAQHPGVWDNAAVLRRTVILGNNGRAEKRSIEHFNGAEAVKSVARDALMEWAARRKEKTVKLALYAHGGLNNEEASLKRVAVLGPWFEANGIFPLFFTWRTGAKETLLHMLNDALPRFLKAEPDFEPAGGMGLWFKKQLEKLKERSADALDYAVESACREFVVRGAWAEMKENAAGSTRLDGGITLTAGHLKYVSDQLAKSGRRLEIHLAAHSAGSILHGYGLRVLGAAGLPVASCHLYAAACSVEFALERYLPQRQAGGILDAAACPFHVHHMTEKTERADTVGGVYRKSLVYLICRALEPDHKTPILGMEAAWNAALDDRKIFNRIFTEPRPGGGVSVMKDFRSSIAGITQHTYDAATHKVSDGESLETPNHGAFDNDIAVITHTLQTMTGRTKLASPVTWLAGY